MRGPSVPPDPSGLRPEGGKDRRIDAASRIDIPSTVGLSPPYIASSATLTSAQLDAFAHDLCDREEAAIAMSWRWLEVSGSADRLYESLFVPAAIRLGEWWESDAICFATVTLGMATLQRLLWSVGRAIPAAPAVGRQTRLLLAPVPGQQHTFGLNLLCEQLRARGGRPVLLASPTRDELLAAVRFGGFEVVGLSVACDDHLHGLPALVRAVREAATKPMRLMLGGPLAGKLSALAERYGVDEVITDAAVERLCALLFQSRSERDEAVAAA